MDNKFYTSLTITGTVRPGGHFGRTGIVQRLRQSGLGSGCRGGGSPVWRDPHVARCQAGIRMYQVIAMASH